MNSKLLHFLCVLACAGILGLGPVKAQNPASTSDANGSAVTAPARQSDASHSAVAPSSDASKDIGPTEAQPAENAAVANDRGTVSVNQATASNFKFGWLWILGLVGLLGLLGLLRRGRRIENKVETRQIRREEQERSEYRRAA